MRVKLGSEREVGASARRIRRMEAVDVCSRSFRPKSDNGQVVTLNWQVDKEYSC